MSILLGQEREELTLLARILAERLALTRPLVTPNPDILSFPAFSCFPLLMLLP